MTEHVASRTLVKSPPELWAECSDAASLARHLGQFGDIKITRLEPETAVAWEGERARGTVRIEPSGWGTKVILTAQSVDEEKPEEVPAVVEVVEVVEAAETPEIAEVVEPAVEVADTPEVEVADTPGVAELVEPAVPEAGDPQAAIPPPRRRRFPRLFRFRRVPPAAEPEPAIEPETVEEDPEPAAQAEPEPGSEDTPERYRESEPEPAREPVVAENATDTATETTEAALTAALDSLGQAHHRPYSRA